MPTPSWIGKLLENPLVTDLVAGRLPEAVQQALADVRLMYSEGRFKPEGLVEGPLDGDKKVDGVGIFPDVDALASARGSAGLCECRRSLAMMTQHVL